jgi:hypothetical protein
MAAPHELFMQIPVVTRTYLAATVGLTIACVRVHWS